MSFSLTPKQLVVQNMLRGPARHKLVFGGARSGKTFLFVRALVTRAVIAPGSRHLITRLRGNAVRASIALDTLPKVMSTCFPGIKLREYRQDGFFALPNDAQIWLGGLDDKERAEKILGQEYVTIFPNECSQIPYSSILLARTRLAQVVKAKVPGRPEFTLPQRGYYDLNPVGSKHWSYVEFNRKLDPESGTPLLYPDNFISNTLNPVDNAQNLSPETLQELQGLPERQRKRFYEGLYGTEVDGALWPAELIAKCRIEGILVSEVSEIVRKGGDDRLPAMRRIVVAIDPSGSSGKESNSSSISKSDQIGIIVAGHGVDGKGYILADRTCDLPPEGWAKVAVAAYHEFAADAIVAETNYGGDMVRFVISAADPKVKFIQVTATRGKWVRAEPISVLYERDLVRHVGRFSELEDQMENFTTGGYVGGKSPDRADALVWALTELNVDPTSQFTGMLEFYRAQARVATDAKGNVAGKPALPKPVNAPAPEVVLPPSIFVPLQVPKGTGVVCGLSRREYVPDETGVIYVLEEDAPPLRRAGFASL